ncbi:hypothetical protein DSL72_006373 [Monilinia vaccinii-corymbosi]|uniref:Carboxypeptidase n=1 Tax=Monilinia vaccinii-corymbosi TaxID=61207 RepID=A0A8A3PNB0_9HELO|nr:hypothetical protein DSL72_006373 [Monilinia vaccinii-corymbosi]
MRFSTVVSTLAVADGIAHAGFHSGRSWRHVGMQDRHIPRVKEPSLNREQQSEKRTTTTNFPYLTNATAKFSVNGAAIPDVDWDVGESYAGLLPISKNPDEERQLYFWFYPSTNEMASDEILIWLNGGPGCSSLEGVFQENGPWTWRYGTYRPVKNPWSWTNLTNVVWVEQPVGTGFSQGTPTATGEQDLAEQFLGFWENFVDTFNLKGRKVYIAGESYAGFYVPYIADAMFNKNDTSTYYNLEATMIYDPTLLNAIPEEQIPSVPFVEYWKGLFPFNDSFVEQIHNISDSCGYTDYLAKYLTFPPPGPHPSLTTLPGTDERGYTTPDCDVFSLIYDAAIRLNPCWDIYQVATTCPMLWDNLGFPGSQAYIPEGATIYFNRTDVQKAINAPIGEWTTCSTNPVFINGTDTADAPSLTVLPSVIERSKRTIIGHGALDMIMMANGTLLTIQNMTWHNAQGFQTKPTDPFYVPYHNELSDSSVAGSGVMGTTHTERNLTFVYINLSGHMVPQYAPSASYRTLEYLLGRIESLTSTEPFTTQKDVPQSMQPSGHGTAPPIKRQLGAMEMEF